MGEIIDIYGREILDSRGFPTVEVEVTIDTDSGEITGRASVPSGASTGTREACELRDKDKSRYNGKGVLKAVENVNTHIANELIGFESAMQTEIDRLLIDLDGTPNKTNLGANAILGTSLAVAKASAEECGLPLFRYMGSPNSRLMPCPMFNVINGGAHAVNNLDIQEFMIVPIGASTFGEALRYGAEIFHVLKSLLKQKNLGCGFGDEGGFAPMLSSNREALDLLVEAIKESGFQPGGEVAIALDAAASEFFDDGKYRLKAESRNLSPEQMIGYWEDIVSGYPVISIEDGLAENDWDGWRLMTSRMKEKIMIVGDDIFVTNKSILEKAIPEIANAVLIKLNQIGTITETLDAMDYAMNNGYKTIVSHRSGETEDNYIAHLAVARNCGYIKTGAPNRSDRVSKYNELLRIEEMLGESALYGKRR